MLHTLSNLSFVFGIGNKKSLTFVWSQFYLSFLFGFWDLYSVLKVLLASSLWISLLVFLPSNFMVLFFFPLSKYLIQRGFILINAEEIQPFPETVTYSQHINWIIHIFVEVKCHLCQTLNLHMYIGSTLNCTVFHWYTCFFYFIKFLFLCSFTVLLILFFASFRMFLAILDYILS